MTNVYEDFWGAVISGKSLIFAHCYEQFAPCAIDYQQFASENPERLARAIERGIPDTLRGMMWCVWLYLCQV